MFDRYRRSLTLAKASFAILRADRELLVFPLLSFVALLLVLIAFAVPFSLTGLNHGSLTAVGAVIAFLFYVVMYTVGFFFNSALIGAALIRLGGGDPTVRDGLRIARSHIGAIVGYAVLSATVGIVLRYIAERLGFIGQIVISIIGFAWTVATFLVVPVLVAEGMGPIEAVKQSAELLRKTWGEQLIGNVGIGLIFGLPTLLVGLVAIVLGIAVAAVSSTLVVGVLVVAFLVIFAISIVAQALTGIYTASLYRYATKGDAGAFDTDALSAAFKPRAGGAKGLFGR